MPPDALLLKLLASPDMRTVITRFFTFNAENSAPEVYGVLATVYLILFGLALSSLVKSDCRNKLAWFLFLTLIPVLGMYAYSLWCLAKADYSFLAKFGLGGFGKPPSR